jgi:hypothetical protein
MSMGDGTLGEGTLGEGGLCGEAAGVGMESLGVLYFCAGGGSTGLGFCSSGVPGGDSVNRGGIVPREMATESRELGAVDLDIGVGRAVDGFTIGFAGLPERDESVDNDGLVPDPGLARFRPD